MTPPFLRNSYLVKPVSLSSLLADALVQLDRLQNTPRTFYWADYWYYPTSEIGTSFWPQPATFQSNEKLNYSDVLYDLSGAWFSQFMVHHVSDLALRSHQYNVTDDPEDIGFNIRIETLDESSPFPLDNTTACSLHALHNISKGYIGSAAALWEPSYVAKEVEGSLQAYTYILREKGIVSHWDDLYFETDFLETLPELRMQEVMTQSFVRAEYQNSEVYPVWRRMLTTIKKYYEFIGI